MPLAVIIPSCTDALLHECLLSMEESEWASACSVIVSDTGLKSENWSVRRVKSPMPKFVHMVALNRVMDNLTNEDIIVLGDDTKITSPGWFTAVNNLLANWPEGYGMLNFTEEKLLEFADPKAWFDQNRESANPVPLQSDQTLPLCGSIIPRAVYDKVGCFDERYIGYGWDDIDYCVRLLHAGYKIGTTSVVTFQHKGAASYCAELVDRSFLLTMSTVNKVLFREKWGLPLSFLETNEWPLAAPHFNRDSCSCARAD